MLLLVLAVVVTGYVLVVLRAARRMAERARSAHPGLDAWRAVRRDLTLGDALSVWVAQAVGRPVGDPRLAGAAHVRGRWVRSAPAGAASGARRLAAGLAVASQAPRLEEAAAGGGLLDRALLVALCTVAALVVVSTLLAKARRRLLERSLAGTPAQPAVTG